MFRPRPSVHLPARPRRRLAAWMAWVMAFQLWTVAYMGTAMAAGTEVCSASGGIQRVDGQGKPLPSANAHTGHDGCCVAAVALPPAESASVSAPLAHGVPADRVGSGRLGADWLAPLSRGPPTGA